MLLGEAQSKCEHVAGVPLRPKVARDLHMLFLAKGVHATTAIEGNTLSEKQVLEHLEGKLDLPKSKAYLQQEIENVASACNEIFEETRKRPAAQRLTLERICHFNAALLNGLKLEESIQPGRIRPYDVGVGSYRAAPHQDCQYLLERLCEWLDGSEFRPDDPKPDRLIVS